MKKIILLFIVSASLHSTSFSQILKGSILTGGDLSFYSQKNTNGVVENKSNGFNFSPTIAVATKENKFFGGSLGVGYNKNIDDPNNYFQKNLFYSAGIYCRTYIPISNKLFAFYQIGLNTSFGKTEINNNNNSNAESRNFGLGLNITPGISYRISKKVFLESGFNNIASISYQHSSTSYSNTSTKTTSNGFGFSSSLSVFSSSLYFGFRFIIPKKA